MAKKKIDLGKMGPAGDAVSVTGTLEDDTISTGDRTSFIVILKREEGLTVTPLTVWIMLLGNSTLKLYPPFKSTGNGRIEKLERGESKRVYFLIDNGPDGVGPAAYSLLCAIQWAEHPPFVLPLFNVP
jgi:hypothetical protein